MPRQEQRESRCGFARETSGGGGLNHHGQTTENRRLTKIMSAGLSLTQISSHCCFAFFVVMFASSQTDKSKAKQISEAVEKALADGKTLGVPPGRRENSRRHGGRQRIG